MNCPVCGSNDHFDIDLQSESFSEGIRVCTVCESTYAINHDAINVIKDTQEKSFLGNREGFYYSFAA